MENRMSDENKNRIFEVTDEKVIQTLYLFDIGSNRYFIYEMIELIGVLADDYNSRGEYMATKNMNGLNREFYEIVGDIHNKEFCSNVVWVVWDRTEKDIMQGWKDYDDCLMEISNRYGPKGFGDNYD